MKILSGIAEIEDKWLGLASNDRLKCGGYNKTAAIKLSDHPRVPEGKLAADTFLQIIETIQQNYSTIQPSTPSRENWRWKQQLNLSTRGIAEKRLERCWAFLTDKDAWINHVPVCSFSTLSEGGRAIDLVHERQERMLEFVELKFGKSPEKPGSNHPLYAALELLEYGLVYLWSRKIGLIPHGKFLKASAVDLIVLAPHSFYHKSRGGPINLAWLANEIGLGLEKVCQEIFPDNCLIMNFRFEMFTGNFQDYYDSLKIAMKQFPEAIAASRQPAYES